MKFLLTQKALRQYEELPSRIQASLDKQLHFLLNDLRHRSLVQLQGTSLGIAIPRPFGERARVRGIE